MRIFRRSAHARSPATPAGADAQAPLWAAEELRARLRLHARRAGVAMAAVLISLSGVSAFLSFVGLVDCSEGDGSVCRETHFYFLSTVTRSVIDVDGSTGEVHGWRAEWYANGEPWIEGHYHQGEKDGVWREHWGNGELRYEGEYTRGRRTGRETWWFSNGNPEWTGAYNDVGLREGSEVWWWESGGVRRVGVMHDGEKDGRFSLWNPDGSLAFSTNHAPDAG